MTDGDLDLARVLDPARPRLADARAVAARVAARAAGGADALWEALAARGVIPLAWVGAAERAFVRPLWEPCGACGGTGAVTRCGRCWGRGAVFVGPVPPPGPHPPDARAAVALAADPQGVATAEALAWEVAARLAPWGVARPARVVWRVEARATLEWALPLPGAHARTAVDAALRRSDPRRASDLDDRFDDVRDWRLAADLRSAAQWAACARAGRAPFATRPDPFAPLVALWATGYALDALSPEALALVCPAVT